MLDAIADGAALDVPALWPLDVTNALAVLVRRRKLTLRLACNDGPLRKAAKRAGVALWK